jgi:hypothetical protein
MSIGGSLLLIAIGAILRFAVTAHVSGVNLPVVGDVLMVVGVVGFVVAAIWLATARRRRTPLGGPGYAVDPRDVRRMPADPYDDPRL